MTAHSVPQSGRTGSRAHFRQRRKARHRVKPGLERLELRCLLSVSWDGGGGNSDWNNPLNWNTDTVPGSTDTAVIDLAGAFTVDLTTDVTNAGFTPGGASGTPTLSTRAHTPTLNGPRTDAPHRLP